jgi:hypothetical protein
VVIQTGEDGQLWLKDSLNIEVDNGSVALGQLPQGQVINANGKFIVYSDGKVFADGGTFTGTVNANEGTIGNLTLEDGNLISDKEKPFSIKITGSDGNDREALTISNGEMTVHGIINTTEGGNIGGFIIRDNKL